MEDKETILILIAVFDEAKAFWISSENGISATHSHYDWNGASAHLTLGDKNQIKLNRPRNELIWETMWQFEKYSPVNVQTVDKISNIRSVGNQISVK